MTCEDILYHRYRGGSEEALEQLYDRMKLPLLKTAALLTGDAAAAEDIVQEVFMNLIKNSGEVKNVKGYLYRAVSNRTKNYFRRKAPVSIEKSPDMAGGERTPQAWLIQNEQLEKLSDALGKVKYEQREAVLLHIEAGLKFRRIAEIQEVSINTVMSRYRYGISKLRSVLSGEA